SELERLAHVQPRIERSLVPAGQIGVHDVIAATQTLGDVLAGQLDVQTAGHRAEAVVNFEEAGDLFDDVVEVPRIVTARRLDRVAVHRVAAPYDFGTGRRHLLNDRRQHVEHAIGAHASHEHQTAGT